MQMKGEEDREGGEEEKETERKEEHHFEGRILTPDLTICSKRRRYHNKSGSLLYKKGGSRSGVTWF